MGIFFTEQFIEYLQYQRKLSPHTITAYKSDLLEFINFIEENFEIQKSE